MKERQCIYKETRTFEYGNIVFPKWYRAGKNSWSSSPRYYRSIKAIRDNYYAEINHILNDFHSRWSWEVFREKFIEYFNELRPFVPFTSDGDGTFDFEWLNYSAVKQVIKNWEGEPFDVLYYLSRQGFIEKTVTLAQKRLVRK
jgi:hypothetical protein